MYHFNPATIASALSRRADGRPEPSGENLYYIIRYDESIGSGDASRIRAYIRETYGITYPRIMVRYIVHLKNTLRP